jgi:hypothetical protein
VLCGGRNDEAAAGIVPDAAGPVARGGCASGGGEAVAAAAPAAAAEAAACSRSICSCCWRSSSSTRRQRSRLPVPSLPERELTLPFRRRELRRSLRRASRLAAASSSVKRRRVIWRPSSCIFIFNETGGDSTWSSRCQVPLPGGGRWPVEGPAAAMGAVAIADSIWGCGGGGADAGVGVIVEAGS